MTNDWPQEATVAELSAGYPAWARSAGRRCQRPVLVSHAIAWGFPSVLLLARHAAQAPTAATLLAAIVIVVVRDLNKHRR